jgi:hypothetical protein
MSVSRFSLTVLGTVAFPVAFAFACSSSEPERGLVPSASVDDAANGPSTHEAGVALADDGAAAVDVDAAPAVVVPGTGGKGGLACTRKDDLGGGRQSCVVTVGGVELKIVEAKGGSGPLRLGLYLHGDGAVAHINNGVLKAMMPWADAHRGLAVSALAPNGCAWWLAITHDCASSGYDDRDVDGDNAVALAAALDAIMKAYDVRTDGIRYYGSSGGSIFLADAWIPLQAASYPGVFAMMCGGAKTSRAYAWNTTDVALRAKNPLWFTYGDQDFLFDQIGTSIAAFKAKSFSVTEKIIPGAGHCQFDAHGEAIGIWSANP